MNLEVFRTSTSRKLECFKQAYALSTLAWNNKIGHEVMINRDSWGHLYFTIRGEISRYVKDGHVYVYIYIYIY